MIIFDHFRTYVDQPKMFFLMKNGIFPNWEDPSNRLGGCLSFKVSSTNVIKEWSDIFLKCILEELLKDGNDKINGLSISPKKEFNIIKIWFSESFKVATLKNLFNILELPPPTLIFLLCSKYVKMFFEFSK